MTEHTPGPWRWGTGYNELYDANNKCVMGVSPGRIYSEYSSDPAEIEIPNKADWELIAAAPDLLEALTEIVEALRIHAPGTTLNNRQFDALGIKAYAAIAKAKGE